MFATDDTHRKAAPCAKARPEELGVTRDLLVVHPAQVAQLRTAYAEGLDDTFKSARLGTFSNLRVPEGWAFVVEQGRAGTPSG